MLLEGIRRGFLQFVLPSEEVRFIGIVKGVCTIGIQISLQFSVQLVVSECSSFLWGSPIQNNR